MPLPNYIHVGQPKAASTTIHALLTGHPDTCLVKMKEAHFFDWNYEKGLDFYEKTFFSGCSGDKVIGDITPNYYDPMTLKRIADMLGRDIKITVCLRFPVARSLSHYFHEARLFNEWRPFEEAIRFGPGYREPSLGSKTMTALYDLFPKENILCLIFERDFARGDPQLVYRRVCDFLDIAPLDRAPVEVRNRSFLPTVTVATTSGKIADHTGIYAFEKGDLIVETLEDASHYRAIVFGNPDAATVRKYGRLEKISKSLRPEDVRNLYNEYFANDVNELRRLLGDELAEWVPETFSLIAPPPVARPARFKDGS
jgi:hypothetical protein